MFGISWWFLGPVIFVIGGILLGMVAGRFCALSNPPQRHYDYIETLEAHDFEPSNLDDFAGYDED